MPVCADGGEVSASVGFSILEPRIDDRRADVDNADTRRSNRRLNIGEHSAPTTVRHTAQFTSRR
jgi:hypothetical protein